MAKSSGRGKGGKGKTLSETLLESGGAFQFGVVKRGGVVGLAKSVKSEQMLKDLTS